jgi:hypothetical protein
MAFSNDYSAVVDDPSRSADSWHPYTLSVMPLGVAVERF